MGHSQLVQLAAQRSFAVSFFGGF